jgi:hypothetical protein
MKSKEAVGFRIHLRHVVILVVFFAAFLGLMIPMVRRLGAAGLCNPPLALLLTAPWLLAVLILILERKSPLKFWLAPLLLSLIAPALAICHDWLILDGWLRLSTVPNLPATLLVNALLIGSFTFFAGDMAPRHCPECKRWAMIPLRGFWGPGIRTPNTRWCAACGAKYWRTTEGEWREERRRTWFDNVKESTKASPFDAKNAKNRFNPDSRVVNPILTIGLGKPLAALNGVEVEPETLIQELRRTAQAGANKRATDREAQPETSVS